MKRWTACVAVLLLPAAQAAGDGPLRERARAAMDKAAAFFRSISTHGGYVGILSLDLKKRYGEALYERAKPTQIWVQPPGTPSVGEVYLRAWRATGEKRYLTAARDVGRALAWGQRTTGGWDHRVDVAHLTPQAARPVRRGTHCTFDDCITQGPLRFLMDLDQVLDEPWLTESIELAWKHMLAAQFPNGAWPQWYPLRGGYHDYYTFNDAAINDCIAVMLKAHRLYGKAEHLRSAKRGGDFIILSQLDPPQAGWAQQYSHDLKPAKARSFEPAGVCSAVAVRNIRTLVELYLATREEKYLRPIPKAAAWLEKSKLGRNLWARLYEVGTNRPIYGDRDGKVHYTLQEISRERRSGYSWQSSYGVPAVLSTYRRVRQIGAEAYLAARSKPPSAAARSSYARRLEPTVERIIASLDAKGRWVTGGMIHCATFVANFGTLCRYVELTKPAS